MRALLSVPFLLLVAGASAAMVREERLPNGLRVLLKRVEGVPIVSVWSWIHAGSANEREGCTGAAHWCEHMCFKGTKKYSREDMKNLLEREGGIWNGYTWLDQTTYYETVPSGALELALDIEAQRLTSSLFSPDEVQSERTVILSELAMGENDPENLLDIETTAVAIKAHPYRWPTVGWRSDVEAMSRDDLFGFYKRYYSPANATLVIVGDFDEEKALVAVKKKFGSLEAGEKAPRIHTKEPEQRGEKRLSLQRGGVTPYILVAYHTPTIDDRDFYPLLALDTALGGAESINLSTVSWRGQASRSSRLYKGLVDRKIASKAGALYLPTKYPFLFCVYATAAPGVDLARLEKDALEIVEDLRNREVSESELAKLITQLRARLVYDMDSVTEQAHMLGFFDTLGNYKFADTFLAEIAGVGAKDILRVARRYLTEDNRTIGWYVPAGSGNESPQPVAQPRSTPPPWPASGYMEGAISRRENAKAAEPQGAASAVRLGATRTVLPNGLTLIVRENRLSPSIAARIDISAGSLLDPPDRHGLANLTAKMLDRGTVGMSASLISDGIDSSGTELEIISDRDRSSISIMMLKEKLPLVMEIAAQMLREPLFPDEELAKVKSQVTTLLEEAGHDTQRVAVDRAYEAVYPPGHPYRHRIEGSIESVRLALRKDLVNFYREHYAPQAVTIVLSGDVAEKDALSLVKKLFGTWKAGRMEERKPIFAPPLPLETKWEKAPIPDKTQVDIAVVVRGVARSSPDYYALELMNTVLGRFGMGGRLGRTIREDKGLAYYAYSSLVPYVGTGVFMVRAGVAPENVDRAVAEIRNAIAAMKDEGVTSRELEESSAYLIKSVPRRLETNQGVASALADAQFYGLGLDYYERYPGIISGVSWKDVRRVAHEYLHPRNLVIVLAGPVK